MKSQTPARFCHCLNVHPGRIHLDQACENVHVRCLLHVQHEKRISRQCLTALPLRSLGDGARAKSEGGWQIAGNFLTVWWFQLAVAKFLRMIRYSESNSDKLKWIEFVRLTRGTRISIDVWVCYVILFLFCNRSCEDVVNLNVCKVYGLLLYDVAVSTCIKFTDLPLKLHGYQVLHRMPESLWCSVGKSLDGSRRRELGCFVSRYEGSLIPIQPFFRFRCLICKLVDF